VGAVYINMLPDTLPKPHWVPGMSWPAHGSSHMEYTSLTHATQCGLTLGAVPLNDYCPPIPVHGKPGPVLSTLPPSSIVLQ